MKYLKRIHLILLILTLTTCSEEEAFKDFNVQTVSKDSLKFNNLPPKPFKPLAPDSGSTNLGFNLAFEWNETTDQDSEDPLKYIFTLYDNFLLNKPILIDTLNTKNHTVSNIFKPHTTYYWHVTAYDKYYSKAKTNTWAFKTKNEIPSIPYVIQPFNQDKFISITPKFKWYKSTDKDKDTVYYSVTINDNNREVFKSKYSKDTLLNHPSREKLAYNTTYKFRVAATDKFSDPVFSNWITFSTEDAPPNQPPKPFTIRTPSKNQVNVPLNGSVAWNPSTDSDGDIQKYQIYLSVPSINYRDTITHSFSTLQYFFKFPSNLTSKLYSQKASVYILAHDNEGGISSSDTVQFQLIYSPENQQTKPFDLVSPTDGQQGVGVDHKFTWQTSKDQDGDPVTYSVFLREGTGVLKLIKDKIKNTFFIMPSNTLKFSTNYSWIVKSSDGIPKNPATSANGNRNWTFKTRGQSSEINSPPSRPRISTPTHATKNLSVIRTPVIWNKSRDNNPKDKLTYSVYLKDVAGTAGYIPVIQNITTVDTALKSNVLDYSRNYKMFIQVSDGQGGINYSDTIDIGTYEVPDLKYRLYKTSDNSTYDASKSIVSSSDVSLSWDPIIHPEASKGLTFEYKLLLGQSRASASNILPNRTHTQMDIAGHVPQEKILFWSVVIFDGNGEEYQYPFRSFTSDKPPINANPTVPQIITPAHLSTNQPTVLTFNWQASSDSDVGDIVSYKVQYCLATSVGCGTNTPVSIKESPYATTTSYRANDLVYNSKYKYRIFARDNHSTPNVVVSNWFEFTTQVKIDNERPVLSSASIFPQNDNEMLTNGSFTWRFDDRDGDVLSYDFYFSKVATGRFNNDDRLFINLKNNNLPLNEVRKSLGSNLEAGVKYYWNVRAKDKYGYSTNSNDVYRFEIKVNQKPSKPEIKYPTASSHITLNKISWKESIDPEKGKVTYKIYLNENETCDPCNTPKYNNIDPALSKPYSFEFKTIEGNKRQISITALPSSDFNFPSQYHLIIEAIDDRNSSIQSDPIVFYNVQGNTQPLSLNSPIDDITNKLSSNAVSFEFFDPNQSKFDPSSMYYEVQVGTSITGLNSYKSSSTPGLFTIAPNSSSANVFKLNTLGYGSQYIWRVRLLSTNPSNPYSNISTFSKFALGDNAAPTSPVFVSPLNNSVVYNSRPKVFKWNKSTDANKDDISYDVLIEKIAVLNETIKQLTKIKVGDNKADYHMYFAKSDPNQVVLTLANNNIFDISNQDYRITVTAHDNAGKSSPKVLSNFSIRYVSKLVAPLNLQLAVDNQVKSEYLSPAEDTLYFHGNAGNKYVKLQWQAAQGGTGSINYTIHYTIGANKHTIDNGSSTSFTPTAAFVSHLDAIDPSGADLNVKWHVVATDTKSGEIAKSSEVSFKYNKTKAIAPDPFDILSPKAAASITQNSDISFTWNTATSPRTKTPATNYYVFRSSVNQNAINIKVNTDSEITNPIYNYRSTLTPGTYKWNVIACDAAIKPSESIDNTKANCRESNSSTFIIKK